MQMDDLYNRSYVLQDYKNCLAVIRERNELMGLKRIEHHVTKTSTTVDLSNHSPKELRQLYQEMKGTTDATVDIDHEIIPQPD